MITRSIAKAVMPAQQMTWAETAVFSCLVLASAVPVGAGLYLIKSAAGINLMAGHSPLHDLLYFIVA